MLPSPLATDGLTTTMHLYYLTRPQEKVEARTQNVLCPTVCVSTLLAVGCLQDETLLLLPEDSHIPPALTLTNLSVQVLSPCDWIACSVVGCITLLTSWQILPCVPWQRPQSGGEIPEVSSFVALCTWAAILQNRRWQLYLTPQGVL